MVFGNLLEYRYKRSAAARPLTLLALHARYVEVTDLARVANGVGSCRTVSSMVVIFLCLYVFYVVSTTVRTRYYKNVPACASTLAKNARETGQWEGPIVR